MKNDTLGIRISSEEKGRWYLYANEIGYDDLSKFIRDSINALIQAKKKPSKLLIIE